MALKLQKELSSSDLIHKKMIFLVYKDSVVRLILQLINYKLILTRQPIFISIRPLFP